MRVIAGEARGFRLQGPAGRFTRPMADKIKGALFSMLASLGVQPERVLDLYAGTGSIGIEALSRGASEADFVEQNASAAAVVRANLEHTRFADRSRVHLMPVGAYLGRTGEPYDLVIMDPPYADPEIVPTLRRLGESALVQSGTIIAIGHSPRVTLPEMTRKLTRLRERCHGDSCFSIYEVVAEDNPVDEGDELPVSGKNEDATRDLPGELRPDHLRAHRRGAASGPAVRRGHPGGVRRNKQTWRAFLDE